MIIYFRITDGGYTKTKLEKATKEVCLRNMLQRFNSKNNHLHLLADNVQDSTLEKLKVRLNNKKLQFNLITVERTNLGSSAESFKYVYNNALDLGQGDNEVVYFLEDDYLHIWDAQALIYEGIDLFHFVTLYDHPDKYINASEGGNPLVADGGEVTKVVKGATRHWKYTNSTTMTFATTLGVLKQSKQIIAPHIQGTYPTDYKMFLDLREAGFSLGSPLPGGSTHIETQWLTPYVMWGGICDHTINCDGDI